MKKILLGLSALFILVLAALVAVPLLYPIDQFRPQILKMVESKVRGKVELGKLSLSVFPALRINVAGLTLHAPPPFDQKPFVHLDHVTIEMPLMSLLVAPRIIVRSSEANVEILSQLEKGGLSKSSLSEFLPPPESAEQIKAAAIESSKGPGLGDSLATLPKIIAARVAAARVSFELDHANVLLESLDNPKTDSVALKDLSLHLENIGIATPIDLSFETMCSGIKGTAVFEGAIKGEGTFKLTPAGKDNRVDFEMKTDLSDLNVKVAPLFHKPSKTPLVIALKGRVDASPLVTTVDLARFELRFANISAGGPLKITTHVTEPEKNDVSLEIKAEKVALQPFGTFVPMVRDFKLAGELSLDVSVKGLMADPAFKVLVTLAKVQGSTPQLQKPVTDLRGTIALSGTAKNPAILIEPFALKVGSSDISFHLDEKGLDTPVANIRIASRHFEADELMGGVQTAPATSTTPDASKNAGPSVPAAALDDQLNAMAPTVEEALKNPLLDKVRATVALDFKDIHFLGAEYTDAAFNLAYANRQLKIAKTGIGAYGGRVTLDTTLGLDPKALNYDFHAGLNGVKIQDVTKAHAPAWKDALTGSMTGELKLSGRGLRKEQLASTLAGGLNGEIKNGQLNVPVVKILTIIAASIPSVAGKKFDMPGKGQDFKGDFKTMKLATAIKGRIIQLQTLDVDYDPQKLGLGEIRFQSSGTVTFDRALDIVGTAYLSPEIVRINELKGPSGKIEIPLKLTGNMSNPTPDIGYSLKILGPRVAQAALKGQAGKAASKIIDQQLQQIQAPPAVKQQIQDLRKKFGF